MLYAQETVGFSYPVHESEFTAVEVQELLSLFQVGEQSGWRGLSRTGSSGDSYERKRRSMISNKEAARRCRWRKKRHLEKLTEQAKGLETKNRSMKSRMGYVVHNYAVTLKENKQLRSEYSALSTRLAHLYSIYHTMQSD